MVVDVVEVVVEAVFIYHNVDWRAMKGNQLGFNLIALCLHQLIVSVYQ